MFIVVLTKSLLVTRCYVRFMRHKVEQDDRFLPQRGEVVLKLGKDVSNSRVNRFSLLLTFSQQMMTCDCFIELDAPS
jgi:hypothetical protein